MGFAKPIEQYLFCNLLTKIHGFMYLKDIIRGNNSMVNELTRENFDKTIREHSTVVVEFYSATCKHCKKLEAGITELSEEAGNDVYFGKVLIPDELSLADEYEISSVPTLLYFKDGEIREKSVGFTHKLIIAENIKKL